MPDTTTLKAVRPSNKPTIKPAPCPTEALLRQIAAIVRFNDAQREVEDASEPVGDALELSVALMRAAVFTAPTSSVGVALIAIANHWYAGTFDDFTDYPADLQDSTLPLRRIFSERSNARECASATLVNALCDAIEDDDLQTVRRNFCTGQAAGWHAEAA
jgi:hypothetical protein